MNSNMVFGWLLPSKHSQGPNWTPSATLAKAKISFPGWRSSVLLALNSGCFRRWILTYSGSKGSPSPQVVPSPEYLAYMNVRLCTSAQLVEASCRMLCPWQKEMPALFQPEVRSEAHLKPPGLNKARQLDGRHAGQGGSPTHERALKPHLGMFPPPPQPLAPQSLMPAVYLLVEGAEDPSCIGMVAAWVCILHCVFPCSQPAFCLRTIPSCPEGNTKHVDIQFINIMWRTFPQVSLCQFGFAFLLQILPIRYPFATLTFPS